MAAKKTTKASTAKKASTTKKTVAKSTVSKAAKSSSIKKSLVKKAPQVAMEDDLYICLSDAVSKRKLLLLALKNSLIVQEEYEKILELRGAKKEVLKEIKEDMDTINLKYQEIRKLLPNVKNVLSYTQKELNELESQIDSIKSSMEQEEQILKDEEVLEMKLKEALKSEPKKQTTKEVLPKTQIEPRVVTTPKVVKKATKKPVTKIDRIKNNLSLIEQKLKGL